MSRLHTVQTSTPADCTDRQSGQVVVSGIPHPNRRLRLCQSGSCRRRKLTRPINQNGRSAWTYGFVRNDTWNIASRKDTFKAGRFRRRRRLRHPGAVAGEASHHGLGWAGSFEGVRPSTSCRRSTRGLSHAAPEQPQAGPDLRRAHASALDRGRVGRTRLVQEHAYAHLCGRRRQRRRCAVRRKARDRADQFRLDAAAQDRQERRQRQGRRAIRPQAGRSRAVANRLADPRARPYHRRHRPRSRAAAEPEEQRRFKPGVAQGQEGRDPRRRAQRRPAQARARRAWLCRTAFVRDDDPADDCDRPSAQARRIQCRADNGSPVANFRRQDL